MDTSLRGVTLRMRAGQNNIRETLMGHSQYRIESNQPLAGRLLPMNRAQSLVFGDRALAVVLAAKSDTQPAGQEIRVVHVATGEGGFRKSAEGTLRDEPLAAVTSVTRPISADCAASG